jgi:mannose-6-phosphate isomerase-like protein (cupin superfamily)
MLINSLTHALVFAAALFQPQAAAPASHATTATTNTEVAVWPQGVAPEGSAHKAFFPNHSVQVTTRDKSGNVEIHQTQSDVMVIKSGEATLLSGGEGVGMHLIGPNELQGTTIKGGISQHVAPGDIIHVPTGLPHQFILAPGTSLTYVLIKVTTTTATK